MRHIVFSAAALGITATSLAQEARADCFYGGSLPEVSEVDGANGQATSEYYSWSSNQRPLLGQTITGYGAVSERQARDFGDLMNFECLYRGNPADPKRYFEEPGVNHIHKIPQTYALVQSHGLSFSFNEDIRDMTAAISETRLALALDHQDYLNAAKGSEDARSAKFMDDTLNLLSCVQERKDGYPDDYTGTYTLLDNGMISRQRDPTSDAGHEAVCNNDYIS